MAQRIMAAGIPMTLWARNPSSLAPFRGRATLAPRLAQLGQTSDVVGVCVTDDAAVREVTLGPAGVLAGMAPGSILAIHSTVGTATCTEVAEAADGHGVAVIDAPVSGGGAAAAAGALTVYVGGSVASVEQARPVLETYGDPVLHMGGLGSGLRTKLINNVLNAAQFGLAHDAMAVGEALGLDPHQLGRALTSGSGRSFSLEVFVGVGSFEPIAGHLGPLLSKDVGLFDLESLPTGVVERAALLTAADRLLALVGHPRTGGQEPVR
jgi:3-hydroxyisobutyrate dehydrogenase-like beta-hydroxyacid dehydrogenase